MNSFEHTDRQNYRHHETGSLQLLEALWREHPEIMREQATREVGTLPVNRFKLTRAPARIVKGVRH